MNTMPNRQPNARGIALDILLQIEKEGAYANLELNKRLRELDLPKLDAAFVTRLVYGVEQNKTYLDHILGQFLQKPPADLPVAILMILRMGVYQLCLLDKIPAHAAINQAVELAKIKGHSGTVRLVNGVLRNIDRKKAEIEIPQWPQQAEDYLVLKESHPRFLARRWLNELGPEETLALCRENNQPALFTLRTNTLNISRAEFLAKLQEAGLQAAASPWTAEAVVIQKNRPRGANPRLPGRVVFGTGCQFSACGLRLIPAAGANRTGSLRRARRQKHAYGAAHAKYRRDPRFGPLCA